MEDLLAHLQITLDNAEWAHNVAFLHAVVEFLAIMLGTIVAIGVMGAIGILAVESILDIRKWYKKKNAPLLIRIHRWKRDTQLGNDLQYKISKDDLICFCILRSLYIGSGPIRRSIPDKENYPVWDNFELVETIDSSLDWMMRHFVNRSRGAS